MRMIEGARKRVRDMANVMGDAATARSSLASRVAGVTPHFWRDVAASADACGADAFLVHLGRSLTIALSSLAESSEAARVELRAMRSTLHAAVDVRCDELGACIDAAEAGKVATFERELVAVDAALERWRTDTAAVRDAVSSLPDIDLVEQHAALSSLLNELDAQLQLLPTSILEPALVGLRVDIPASLSFVSGLGHVIAPLGAAPSDLRWDGLPRRALPGRTLRCRLSLSDRHASHSTEEVGLSLGILAGATRVEATLQGPEAMPLLLHTTASPDADAALRCLIVAIEIPASLVEKSLSIRLTVAGQSAAKYPVHIPVRQGILAPLVVKSAFLDDDSRICISSAGYLYCVSYEGDLVLVFDVDGAPHRSISGKRLGLSDICSVAFVNGKEPCLFLADLDSKVVAVDPTMRTVRWQWTCDTHAKSGHVLAQAMATIECLGVMMVACNDSLYALRLSDGGLQGRLPTPGLGCSLASHATSSAVTLFGTVKSTTAFPLHRYTVHAWTCATDGVSLRISQTGPLAAIKPSYAKLFLAVMPPAANKTTSHLLIATAAELRVYRLTLPDVALVHTHILEGMEVAGIAADPWGEALAVCDCDSESIHVLAWPLSGMPPLE